MKKIVILLIVLGVFNEQKLIAQEGCPVKSLFKTNFLSDGKDSSRLFFPLNFIINSDSIIITYAKIKSEFASFRIINKECFWNEDFSEGKSEYKLMLYDVRGNKYPTLNIIADKRQPVYIELLYENSEKRVFTQL